MSEAVKCYHNQSFWVKIRTLPVALVITFAVRQRVAVRAEFVTGVEKPRRRDLPASPDWRVVVELRPDGVAGDRGPVADTNTAPAFRGETRLRNVHSAVQGFAVPDPAAAAAARSSERAPLRIFCIA